MAPAALSAFSLALSLTCIPDNMLTVTRPELRLGMVLIDEEKWAGGKIVEAV